MLDAHRNLSNLIALMDTANIALVNTKTEIDSLQPVMRIPQQESALDLVEQNQYHL